MANLNEKHLETEEFLFLQQQQLIMYQMQNLKHQSATVATVEDDGLSMSDRSLSMNGIPAHIVREQQEIEQRIYEQRERSTGTLAVTPRTLSRATLHEDVQVPSVASLPLSVPFSPAEQRARADWEAKQQAQIPLVAQALAQRRLERNYSVPEPPQTIESDEIDVDDLVVERLQSPNIKAARLSVSSFDDFRVGAFNIRNAGQPPLHPSDTQSQRSIIPAHIQQQPSESEQSTITQSISAYSPRTNWTNEEATLALHKAAEAYLVEEPSTPPLPTTIATEVCIAPLQDCHLDLEGNNSSNAHQKPPPRQEQKSTLAYVVGGGGFFVTIGGIFLLLCLYVKAFSDVGIYQEKQETIVTPIPNPTSAPSQIIISPSPTPAPTAPPTPFVLDLPDFTLQAIQGFPIDPTNPNSGSPQARAYQWLVQDVAYHPERSTQKKYQRFALATLYFATNYYSPSKYGNSGEVDTSLTIDAWKRSLGWLDHTLDECEWETFGSTGRDLPSPYRVCHPETGEYESLVLVDNGLRGSIPPELSFITSLQYLDFGQNDLQYAVYCLPTQLGLLTNLEQFQLFFSYAKGPIPSEIGLLTKLKTLQLERNRFSETIPTQVGLLQGLTQFVVERNQLQGTLPSELGIPLSLELWELNVENNYMTGTIPATFNEAMLIRKQRDGESVTSNGNDLSILLRGNAFTGTIPVEMCDLQQRLDFDCESTGNPEERLCGCDCECLVMEEEGNPDNGFV